MSSDTNFGTGYYLSSVGEGGGATENFGRIQRGDHSNLFEKWRRGGGDPESHQKLPGGITSVKQHSKGGSAKFHLV